MLGNLLVARVQPAEVHDAFYPGALCLLPKLAGHLRFFLRETGAVVHGVQQVPGAVRALERGSDVRPFAGVTFDDLHLIAPGLAQRLVLVPGEDLHAPAVVKQFFTTSPPT